MDIKKKGRRKLDQLGIEKVGTLGLLLRAKQEGFLIKRVLAYQLAQEMKRANLTRTQLARRMKTSLASVNRLLDPQYVSVTLQTMERAALAIGKKLRIELA